MNDNGDQNDNVGAAEEAQHAGNAGSTSDLFGGVNNSYQGGMTAVSTSAPGWWYTNYYAQLYPCVPYPVYTMVPTYTPPLPEAYRLALEVLKLSDLDPGLRDLAQKVIAKGLGGG
jgi:hypothetical protein